MTTEHTQSRPVVINDCFGGFGLSLEGERAYLARKGKQAFFYENERTPEGRIDFNSYRRANEDDPMLVVYTVTKDLGDTPSKDEFDAVYNRENGTRFYDGDVSRDDPDLVAVVHDLREKANGFCANLKVVEIPADVEWEISEYDGLEHVAEKHRVWS